MYSLLWIGNEFLPYIHINTDHQHGLETWQLLEAPVRSPSFVSSAVSLFTIRVIDDFIIFGSSISFWILLRFFHFASILLRVLFIFHFTSILPRVFLIFFLWSVKDSIVGLEVDEILPKHMVEKSSEVISVLLGNLQNACVLFILCMKWEKKEQQIRLLTKKRLTRRLNHTPFDRARSEFQWFFGANFGRSRLEHISLIFRCKSSAERDWSKF